MRAIAWVAASFGIAAGIAACSSGADGSPPAVQAGATAAQAATGHDPAIAAGNFRASLYGARDRSRPAIPGAVIALSVSADGSHGVGWIDVGDHFELFTLSPIDSAAPAGGQTNLVARVTIPGMPLGVHRTPWSGIYHLQGKADGTYTGSIVQLVELTGADTVAAYAASSGSTSLPTVPDFGPPVCMNDADCAGYALAPSPGGYACIQNACLTAQPVTCIIDQGCPVPPPACGHTDLTTGTKLSTTCSACVRDVCATDPYCCDTQWDSICVDDVGSICGAGGGSGSSSSSSGGGGGTCAHSISTTGTKLATTCDTCVLEICTSDSYCCTTKWDSICVSEVGSICGADAGGGGPIAACAHPVTSTGPALAAGCGECATQVCAADAYCCTTGWDSGCVSESNTLCGSESCAHSQCSTGSKLVNACDVCVTQVCSEDPYCCTTLWDSVCVKDVDAICGQTCP